jgi:hypothetical protein
MATSAESAFSDGGEALRQELARLLDASAEDRGLFYEYNSNESTDSDHVLFHVLGAWRIAPGFHDLLCTGNTFRRQLLAAPFASGTTSCSANLLTMEELLPGIRITLTGPEPTACPPDLLIGSMIEPRKRMLALHRRCHHWLIRPSPGSQEI